MSPEPRFKRVQLFVRLLVLAALGMVHGRDVSLSGLLYVFLPVIAAILISQRGAAKYLETDAPWLSSLLEWVVGFYAYMMFVTDVFPLGQRDRAVQLRVTAGGTPSVGSALLRMLTSIPFILLLALIGLGSFVVGVIAAFSILLFESYPEAMRSFQQDVVTWMARLFAYHASLVADYPTIGMAARPSSAHSTP